jgi:hypothetical protein
MMERNKNVVTWDSQTAITEQGVDDVDEQDSADEQKMEKSSIFWCRKRHFLSQSPFYFKKMISRHKKIKRTVVVSDAGRLTAVVSWQFYPGSCGN